MGGGGLAWLVLARACCALCCCRVHIPLAAVWPRPPVVAEAAIMDALAAIEALVGAARDTLARVARPAIRADAQALDCIACAVAGAEEAILARARHLAAVVARPSGGADARPIDARAARWRRRNKGFDRGGAVNLGGHRRVGDALVTRVPGALHRAGAARAVEAAPPIVTLALARRGARSVAGARVWAEGLGAILSVAAERAVAHALVAEPVARAAIRACGRLAGFAAPAVLAYACEVGLACATARAALLAGWNLCRTEVNERTRIKRMGVSERAERKVERRRTLQGKGRRRVRSSRSRSSRRGTHTRRSPCTRRARSSHLGTR